MKNTTTDNDLRDTVTKECDAIIRGLKRPLHKYDGAWTYKRGPHLWSVNLDIADALTSDRVRNYSDGLIADAVTDEMRELIRAVRRLQGLS